MRCFRPTPRPLPLILPHRIYDPTHRAHLSSTSLLVYLATHPPTETTPPFPGSLNELLDILSTRRVTGNTAKATVAAFLWENGILGEGEQSEEAQGAMNMFLRVLDRNLVAGFGARTLLMVPWPDRAASSRNQLEAGSASTNTGSVDATSTREIVGPPPANVIPPDPGLSSSSRAPSRSGSSPNPTSSSHKLEAFSCALGKTILPPFAELSKGRSGSDKWYASRKLDGVRVLSLLDFYLPSSPLAPPELVGLNFSSRHGKPFNSLANLGEQLAHLVRFPMLREWLDRDPQVVEQREGGTVKRLVLDGEVCVMRDTQPVIGPNRVASSGTEQSGASALWEANDDLVEDFPATVSAIRSAGSIPHPRYFIFDILSWAEVMAKRAVDEPGLGKTFGQRVPDGKALVRFLDGELEKQGVGEKMVRALVQWEVGEVAEVEKMVERAAKEGWEGLILRADKPYKGSRT